MALVQFGLNGLMEHSELKAVVVCENCKREICVVDEDEMMGISRGFGSVLCFDCEDIPLPKFRWMRHEEIQRIKRKLGLRETEEIKPNQWYFWGSEAVKWVCYWTKKDGWRIWRYSPEEDRYLLSRVGVPGKTIGILVTKYEFLPLRIG